MRIISPFKDFYDSASQFGQDLTQVYVRKTAQMTRFDRPAEVPDELQALELFFLEWRRSAPGFWESRPFQVSVGAVLFAGKLYPFARVGPQSSLWAEPHERAVSICFSLDDLDKALTERGIQNRPRSWSEARAVAWRRTTIESWSSLLGAAPSLALQAFCVEKRICCAVFHAENQLVAINPRLSDWQFYKKLDAWQAYQELSMFVSNLTAPDNKAVQIEDKYRVAQHGFDEWSFRKMPST